MAERNTHPIARVFLRGLVLILPLVITAGLLIWVWGILADNVVGQIDNGVRALVEMLVKLVGEKGLSPEEIAAQARELLQKELDEAETGIRVSTIEMKKTNVPEPVQPSFNKVNQAGQEKERVIYQAREAYNKVIPAAKGQAEKTVKAAEGYALNRVNRAKGDAARFTSIYEEYAKAKDVTKRRMYLETMRTLFPKLGQKFIVDAEQKNFLPLLNMTNQSGAQK